MTRPTAVLVDDEPGLTAQLRSELAVQWPELEIVGEALDGPAALELVEEHEPSFVFLDIKLPGMSGLEVARRLVGQSHVVFVTAYDQYAVQAFEAAAIDYLLKPVDPARLSMAVARLKARAPADPPVMGAMLDGLVERMRPRAGWLQWLKVQHGDDLVLVPVQDVAVFRSSDKYTLALTREQEWIIRTALKELEEKLDPERFWRVHRNAIVRVDAIERVTRDDRGQVVIRLRELALSIAVSRSYASVFKQM
jgi:DNA-binding LytR/AlgR family response regulator